MSNEEIKPEVPLLEGDFANILKEYAPHGNSGLLKVPQYCSRYSRVFYYLSYASLVLFLMLFLGQEA